MLNHFHFLDSGRDGQRPLTFSRYAGPGSHRYPVGFSGDSHITWASLDFQPYFTATASNIGYGWWSHDVGGHMFGVRDDELADPLGPARRLLADPAAALRRAIRSSPRSRGVPGRRPRAAMTDVAAVPPPARAVPAHDEPPRRRAACRWCSRCTASTRASSDAYEVPNQFAFGTELLVAPITTPRDAVTLRGAVRAWLPAGTWIDVFTGTVYDGDRMVELHRDLDSIPALLRAGGILPLAAEDDLDATRNPERLELLVAPGADGEFTLIEDDGTGATPADIPAARTTIAWRQADGVLEIGAADDPHGVLPRSREWTVTILGAERESISLAGPTDQPLRAEAGADPRPRTAGRPDALYALLNAAQYGHEAKATAWETITADLAPSAKLAELHAQGLPRELIGALSELLTAS